MQNVYKYNFVVFKYFPASLLFLAYEIIFLPYRDTELLFVVVTVVVLNSKSHTNEEGDHGWQNG